MGYYFNRKNWLCGFLIGLAAVFSLVHPRALAAAEDSEVTRWLTESESLMAEAETKDAADSEKLKALKNLYDGGNQVAGLWAELLALRVEPAQAAKWAEENKKNSLEPVLSRLSVSDHHALTMLFFINDRGLAGHRQNEAAALSLMEKAAAKGEVKAASFLAGFYINKGFADRQSQVKAIHWLEKAAAGGDLDSQYVLAANYLNGLFGLKKDPSLALKWLTKTAEGGHPAGAMDLGLIYHYGLPEDHKIVLNIPHEEKNRVDKDAALASRWLKRAAESGNPEARLYYAVYYAHGLKVTAENSGEIQAMFLKSADKASPEQCYYLGILNSGRFPEFNKNPAEALKWLTKAADGGNVQASALLGVLYVNDHLDLGVPVNEPEAEKWLKAASAAGDMQSRLNLLQLQQRRNQRNNDFSRE